MIQLRHRQPSLWHSGLAKDIEDLWEPWMKEVDQLLEDAALVESVYDAQGKRHRKSRTHGWGGGEVAFSPEPAVFNGSRGQADTSRQPRRPRAPARRTRRHRPADQSC